MNRTMEIERKFLVSGEYKSFSSAKYRITQGYLSSVPDRTVRIRIYGTKGFITIKGRSSESGASRFEWEKEISLEEAENLLQLCEEGVIDKIRYHIYFGKHHFEVDEFMGSNEGLTLAEIELKSEDEDFQRPQWLGPEVTGDTRYYNSMLSRFPFTKWKE
jgi:adenylate cyclase